MLAFKIEKTLHCVKSVRIRSYSGPYFLAFGLNAEIYSVRMRGNADQNNSEYVLFCHFTQQNLIYRKCFYKLVIISEN